MIVAIPVWQGRVSPVFDVAGQLLLVELDDGRELGRRCEPLPDESPEQRAGRLAELGVQTLICGAISRPLEALLGVGRVEVVPRVCGDVEEVLRAFTAGALEDGRFAMPGCCGQNRGWRRGRGRCRRGHGPA